MSNTKIEWADKSWNPITGCSPVSKGCRNCYAKRMSNRLKDRYGYPKDDPFRVTFHPDRLDEPLHWKKPSRIFVVSMGDIFHDDVDGFWLSAIWSIIERAYWHTFLVLTKRPERWGRLTPPLPLYKNLMLGVSVEDQKTADERIPILLQIPEAKRFVSVEPMLGPVDLEPYLNFGRLVEKWDSLNWVIIGGLSLPGGKIQPPKHEWLNYLIHQSDAARIPIFIKPNAGYPIERREFPS